MAERDLIVIGTSTGGVQALTQVVAALPSGFPASVLIVCHLPAGYRSVLPEILSRADPSWPAIPVTATGFSLAISTSRPRISICSSPVRAKYDWRVVLAKTIIDRR